jgi:hypothetical protein
LKRAFLKKGGKMRVFAAVFCVFLGLCGVAFCLLCLWVFDRALFLRIVAALSAALKALVAVVLAVVFIGLSPLLLVGAAAFIIAKS